MIRRLLLLVCVCLLGVAAAQTSPGPAPLPKKRTKVVQVMSASADRPKSFLGIGVIEVDPALAKERKLPDAAGVEITKISDDTAAAKAGLLKGDIIVEYNGQPVQGVEQFVRLVRETPVGRKVTLKVSREGKMQTLDATMGACDKCGSMFAWTGKDLEDFAVGIPQPPRPPEAWFPQGGWSPDTPHLFTTWKSSRLGIEAESLESQLAEFFGVKEGVLVRNVSKGSAAEKAGLKAGDVITKVGDSPVSKPRDVSRAIKESSAGTLPVIVVREKRETTLTLTVERNPSGDGGIQRLISEDAMRL